MIIIYYSQRLCNRFLNQISDFLKLYIIYTLHKRFSVVYLCKPIHIWNFVSHMTSHPPASRSANDPGSVIVSKRLSVFSVLIPIWMQQSRLRQCKTTVYFPAAAPKPGFVQKIAQTFFWKQSWHLWKCVILLNQRLDKRLRNFCTKMSVHTGDWFINLPEHERPGTGRPGKERKCPKKTAKAR